MGLRGIGERLAAFGADGRSTARVAAVWAGEWIAGAACDEEDPGGGDGEREDEGPEGDKHDLGSAAEGDRLESFELLKHRGHRVKLDSPVTIAIEACWAK